MTTKELEDLSQEIAQLRRSVRKANPFLRSILELRTYAILALPLGALIASFCLATRFFTQGRGSEGGIPSWWSGLSWILLALFLILGAIAKWVTISKKAAELRSGATVWTAFMAIYSRGAISLNLALTVCVPIAVAFAIWIGHPWYIVPVTAVFLGLLCNSMAQDTESAEYFWTGWYGIGAGSASLFFVEGEPFIWTAIVWGGFFIVYGVAGLAAAARREERSR